MSAGFGYKVCKIFGEAAESLIELFYPRLCVVCRQSLMKGEIYFCSGCLADFPFADSDFGTGEEVLVRFDPLCRPGKLFALYYYNKYSEYRNLIYLIKYHSHRKLGVYLGKMLGQRIKDTCKADCIVPIPLHWKREKERGFNQACEIANGMSEVLGIEVLNDVVVRVKNNVSQTGKNPGERLRNVENIFSLHCPEKIRGRHILLLDDVITTGATIGACLKVLSEAGNVRFSLACLAQTTG